MDVGGTGSATPEEASAAADAPALEAGFDDATGVHGGGGHAVMVAAVGGGSLLGWAEATATSGAVPGGFSGAMTGGSPSHPRETPGPIDTNASSVKKRFMAISIQ
jgi:hypothetical protein